MIASRSVDAIVAAIESDSVIDADADDLIAGKANVQDLSGPTG